MFATLCDTHPDLALVSTANLQERQYVLDTWPLSLADALHNDPRCGCAEDGAGAVCQWDSTDAIDNELASRGV